MALTSAQPGYLIPPMTVPPVWQLALSKSLHTRPWSGPKLNDVPDGLSMLTQLPARAAVQAQPPVQCVPVQEYAPMSWTSRPCGAQRARKGSVRRERTVMGYMVDVYV